MPHQLTTWQCTSCGLEAMVRPGVPVVCRCGLYWSGLITNGPGDYLHELLARLRIHPRPGCRCDEMRRQMNSWGHDGCLEHIEDIVEVMRHEASERGLPFFAWYARRLILRAVARAACQQSSTTR